ncbi:hypothetical protein SCLCIDRAFT_1206562 [Scleroderma citrinum Foug A]|uniref:Uncharacterized protein n=1 Tax=Scleroderma citrinum Foug A TaxID=1036808 RepID=A0A0C3EQK8_9AGAM|nr:hypothetical protein SCLCIDRAFT_1206562 [Scleroderma citrinum Foug A]
MKIEANFCCRVRHSLLLSSIVQEDPPRRGISCGELVALASLANLGSKDRLRRAKTIDLCQNLLTICHFQVFIVSNLIYPNSRAPAKFPHRKTTTQKSCSSRGASLQKGRATVQGRYQSFGRWWYACCARTYP